MQSHSVWHPYVCKTLANRKFDDSVPCWARAWAEEILASSEYLHSLKTFSQELYILPREASTLQSSLCP